MNRIAAAVNCSILKKVLPLLLFEDTQRVIDRSTRAEFAERYRAAADSGSASCPLVSFEKPFGAYDFLRYLGESGDVVFHGSSEEVDRLDPRFSRQPRGEERSLFAASDAMGAIRWGLHKRVLETGSCNRGRTVLGGTYRIENRRGVVREYSYLSINNACRAAPLPPVIVYICPRDAFTPIEPAGAYRMATLTGGRITPVRVWKTRKRIAPIGKMEIGLTDVPCGFSRHGSGDLLIAVLVRFRRRRR